MFMQERSNTLSLEQSPWVKKNLLTNPILINYGHSSLLIPFLMMLLLKIEAANKELTCN